MFCTFLLFDHFSTKKLLLINFANIALTLCVILSNHFIKSKVIKYIPSVLYSLCCCAILFKLGYNVFQKTSYTPTTITLELNDFYPYGGLNNKDKLPEYNKELLPVDFKMGNSYIKLDSSQNFAHLSGSIGKNLFKKSFFDDAPIILNDGKKEKQEEKTTEDEENTEEDKKPVVAMNFAHPNSYIKASGSMESLQSLVNRNTSAIITGKLTKEQEQYVKENKARLEYNPICKDAVVFFVHKDTPIDNIKLEDLKKILSGEYYLWDELGVEDFGTIKLLQTPRTDSTYATIEENVCAMKEPKEKELYTSTIEVINQVGNFVKNKGAIGYGLRSQVETIINSPDIKILTIDNVRANNRTISKSEYPLSLTVYLVNTDWLITDSLQEEKTKNAFVKWIVTKNGQSLVQSSGFVPWGMQEFEEKDGKAS